MKNFETLLAFWLPFSLSLMKCVWSTLCPIAFLFELLVRIAELLAIFRIETSANDRDPVHEPWSRSAVYP